MAALQDARYLGKEVVTHHAGHTTEHTLAPRGGWSDVDAAEHCVQFYETDAFLVGALRSYVAAGFDAGDACLVIATPAHRASLEDQLTADGIDLALARGEGGYRCLDAERMLSKLLLDGMPDPARFADVVGRLVVRAGRDQRRVRIFGEMVALLCAEGNWAAALRLEELWNDLGQNGTQPFSLFCGYTMSGFAGQEHGEFFTAICQQHSRVLPDESYLALTSADARLRVISRLQQKAASLEAEIAERKRTEERLRMANQRLDEFIGIAGHELRTPITSARLNTQLAQRYLQRILEMPADGVGLPPELCDQLDRLHDLCDRTYRQMQRQERLVSDMLDLSRIQSGKLELRVGDCDLARVVAEAVEEQRLLSPERTIRIEMRAGREDMALVADAERIGQVVTNYLSNALKYSDEGQPVAVRVERDEHTVRVSVRDRGPGLPRGKREDIWERFQRAEGVDVRSGSGIGLGLGLYISKTIVERHGGAVGVESRVGQGSTFWFTLPL